MSKNSQQIAEQLARKCAFDMCHAIKVEQHQVSCDEWIASFSHSKVEKLILQSIPLVELVECVASLKLVRGHHVCDCHSCTAQTNLTTKLKQLGIDV